jgi:hypothetical protein
MHRGVIASTTSFYMGLSSAEGQKLQYFKCTGNNIFKAHLNPLDILSNKAIPEFYLIQAFSMCILKSLWLMSISL